MAKKRPNAALLKLVSKSTLEVLRDIHKLHVRRYAADAASAVGEGAILLGISRVDNDAEGDGFRYLIGLQRGTTVSPHLSCFF